MESSFIEHYTGIRADPFKAEFFFLHFTLTTA